MFSKVPIDLLVFDFDGTLVNSVPGVVASIHAMQAELNLPHKTEQEISRHIGYGEKFLFEAVLGSKDQKLYEKAFGAYSKHYRNKSLEETNIFPHLKEILEEFKDKIKVIISNKREEFIRLILENHQIAGYFAEIVGGDSSPCLKPDPRAIKDILKKYKILPERALFVGDMLVDIETGKNAGVLTCGVTYGLEGREKLKNTHPDFLVDDLLELKDLVK